MRVVVVAVAVLVALVASGTVEAQTPPGVALAPNVLIILTDDQRTKTLADMPETRLRFQEQGVTYTNGYVTTPLCCPSRASILTGRYAHNHGVLRNRRPRQLDQETTLQYYLQQAGYRTAISGKFLTSWRLQDDPPFFDRWAIYNNGYNDAIFNVDGTLAVADRYSTTFVGKNAVEFLSSFETEDVLPWFLFVTPSAPHRPATPEAQYADAEVSPGRITPAMVEKDRSDKPPYVLSEKPDLAKAERLRVQQQRTLMSVDDMVADVFATMDQLGETDNTLAFYLSDNGFLLGEHGIIGKRLPYTESVEVPFLMRWPGQVNEGAIDDRLAANIDLAPTIIEAIDETLLSPDKPPMDGRSLLSGEEREYAFIEHWGNPETGVQDWGSIMNEDLQLIDYYRPYSARMEFREFYDLERDPWQLRNLIGDGDRSNDPENIADLRRILLNARTCAGDNCP